MRVKQEGVSLKMESPQTVVVENVSGIQLRDSLGGEQGPSGVCLADMATLN